MNSRPNLFIIAGANGAGKTTSSFSVFPEILKCKEYINADSIAKAISPFNSDSVSIEAGKILLKRIERLISEKVDFAFETTLSSKSIVGIIENAKSSGYKINILFFYLNSYQIAYNRVIERVKHGGHNIPKDVIKRRYFRGIINLINIYKNNSDYCIIVNNSSSDPKVISEIKNNLKQLVIVHSEKEWNQLNNYAKRKK